ncbi:MAG: hypothetical protein J5476_17550 [Lachnospiraceae bacterium]|nr:hypothetical protein [Lachnospiraceae bacterium]
MNNLFFLFIFVVVVAFAIIPLMAVKGGAGSKDDPLGTGRRSSGKRTHRKKSKDRVSVKVSSVRKSKDGTDSGSKGIIEFRIESGTDRATVVDEDIDSFIVTGSLEGMPVSGFDYSNQKDLVYHDCRMIKKSEVSSYYKDCIETKYFYKDQPVQIAERDGQTFAEVYEGPASYLREFSVMDMGGNGRKYYKRIDEDDPDLKTQEEHIREELIVDTYGVTPEMSKKEYEDALVKYLTDRITRSGMKKDTLVRLLLGIYGYRFPDDGLFTDIETVFEKVIPLRYKQLGDNAVSRSNFRRELITAISVGYRLVGCRYGYTLVDDGRVITPSPEYSLYICLVLHLMLMRYHKEGKRPYCELDLSGVWKKLEESIKKDGLAENHNPVYHGDVLLCEDLGAFTIEALKKLVYFKQFDKSGDDKNGTG